MKIERHDGLVKPRPSWFGRLSDQYCSS